MAADRTLTDDELGSFGDNGYLVIHDVVDEPLLAELDGEAKECVERTPPPDDKVGFHHYFEHPTALPVARRALAESGVLALARQLVAPLDIDLAFDHIQLATSVHGWDHRPEGGHIDGYGLPGQTEPATFSLLAGIYLDDESEPGRGNLWVWPGSHHTHAELFRERGVDVLLGPESQGGHAGLLDPPPEFGESRPVLARRGDVVLAHYLLAHNQSGNMWSPLRRIFYYRLAAAGHRSRWAATQVDPLLEYAPVRLRRPRMSASRRGVEQQQGGDSVA